MAYKLAYCTNVHAGADLAQTRQNLLRHAVQVKRQCSPNQSMGIGLWLSAQTAHDLLQQEQTDEFADWLRHNGLVPFTFNGFPFGDFHQEVVKHKVYHPTWAEPERLAYTLNLVALLDRLAPAGWEGSISTLPLAWRNPPADDAWWQAVRTQLRNLANQLHRFEQETGRLVYVCIEPEPGCLLQTSGDVVQLFQGQLLQGMSAAEEESILRHLRVCHDVCHAVVMCESQESVLQAYDKAGIRVGKVQISSAVCVPFDRIPWGDRQAAFAQLASFAEDRYLHQTTIQQADATPLFFDDLPAALEFAVQSGELSGTWRVHFHVPVYLERFGLLETSRHDIEACLQACRARPEIEHFEVETYAWGVLPAHLQVADLASGIAAEMNWFRQLMSAR